MKKVTIILTGVILMSIASFNANAQINLGGPAAATAVTNATIIAPIQISKTVDLNFGNIVALTSEETVTVNPTGARSSSNALSIPTAILGTIKAASFTVTGEVGATYSIVLPTEFNVTSSASGSVPMKVNGFTSTPTPIGSLTGGTQELTVGATLTVGANQAAGTYTNANALSVTVAYN